MALFRKNSWQAACSYVGSVRYFTTANSKREVFLKVLLAPTILTRLSASHLQALGRRSLRWRQTFTVRRSGAWASSFSVLETLAFARKETPTL